MNKTTNRSALTYVLENCELPTEISEKLTAMLSALDAKTANRKPTKEQEENENFKNEIVALLMEAGASTATEIRTNVPGLDAWQVQKTSALLKALSEENRVTSEMVKGKKMFSAVGV